MGKYLATLLAVAVLGCAGKEPRPAAHESVIVFILPGMTSDRGAYQPSYGATPSVSIHDVSGERKIVGILSTGQKLGYRVRPGRYQFMLANRVSTDFMEANFGAGRTYYVVLQLQGGGYDQRYAFKPVRPADFASGLFARWDTGASIVDRADAWQRWDKGNQKSVEARLREHRPAWDNLGKDERALRTVEASDGR